MKTLTQRLAAVQKSVKNIPKNGYNSFHKYKYILESDLINSVRESLDEHGIIVIPNVKECKTEMVPKDKEKGSVQPLVTITVQYAIQNIDDKNDCYVVDFVGQEIGDKALFKAYTGCHKYFYLRLLNIGSDEDPERDEEHAPTPTKKAAPKVDPKPDITAWTSDKAGNHIITSECKQKGKSVLQVFTEDEAWVSKVILSDSLRKKLDPQDLSALAFYSNYINDIPKEKQ